MTSIDPVSPVRQPGHVLAILGLLMGFASISTDLYLPAMPDIRTSLGTTSGMVELTVSGYLVGFSLGQLAWGPISDRLGRRLPISVGLTLFILGSAGCALAESINVMLGCRIVQAAGACASVVLSRAMVRDLYRGDRAARMMSTLITVMAVAPLTGPLVGGQILRLANWRGIFWALVVIGLAALLAVWTLPETLPPGRRVRGSFLQVLSGYGALLLDLRLMGTAGAGALIYGGSFAYVAGSPFVYISYYHVGPQFYGFLFGAGIIGMMCANLLNGRLVTRYGARQMLRCGSCLAALSGGLLALDAWTGWWSIWGVFIPVFFFVSSSGFIFANSITLATEDFPRSAGTVAGLVGALQYGCGMLAAALVGACADGTPWPMGWVIALAATGSLFCAYLHRGSHQRMPR
ncbi:multidrug effflux MFS transporter [Gluconobacter sphaericus]|jgi:DHA1 family bicyclomycin/chloramphenicol resistance-like MFS transporter|uniref:multidrug effflux MFS transporter n=1 Tax=Gluconobacter sphaericus TaxID=574987 RepID=UPI001B8BB18D|nr:multidrug effflux MFS transporter [Gluconobacter sphaericus]MBS1097820.1 multidrug effflux MFS transporter [Gluconobacter sphaericus]MCH4023197.1 multidrug effflux MFS transporter [Acetobacter sp.]MCH4061382.1 multidrug effflux MFS transporter [Acetobacter sp.]MCH4088319.1 multidrug effflux MFS transporter [Acetobacter sp.]